MVIIFYSGI